MRRVVAAFLSFVALALVRAPVGVRAGDAEATPIEVTARRRSAEESTATVRIEPGGRARVVVESSRVSAAGVALDFVLTPAELDELRRLVVESGFFGEWPREPLVYDGERWDVTVRLGDRSFERRGVIEQPAFEPLRGYLERFVRQARTTAALRLGDGDSERHQIGQGPMDEFFVRPLALAPEVVTCAASIVRPDRCARMAVVLLSFPVETWTRSAQDLLGRLEGDRRAAVLSAWADRLRAPAMKERWIAFRAIALNDVERARPNWASLPRAERMGVEALLRMLLADRLPEAFAIAEALAKALATPEHAYRPQGLVEAGTAAIPTILRLLEAESPVVRAGAADMARTLAAFVRERRGYERVLPDAERPALEAALRSDLVPALERRSGDPSESFSVRKACFDALDAWDGRVKAAEAQAAADRAEERRREDAQRRAPSPPALEGSLVIAGRLVGPFESPLAGFSVLAVRSDGRCTRSAKTGADGSFRVEGLAEGAYSIGARSPGDGPFSETRGPFDRDEVAAGATDVVVRPAGAMIRGRLFDASGSPAAGRRVLGQMRDAPSMQGPAFGSDLATTDAEGRFWLLRLLPGVYDLDVSGELALDGARGVETGPDERTVRLLEGASIVGRVVDETGAPLAGVEVNASDPAPFGRALQETATQSDGTFRLARLDPAGRYHVWARLSGSDSAHADAKDVAPGVEDLTLRVDTTPRLRVRVTFVGRERSYPVAIRLERVAGGDFAAREFREAFVDWRGAPPGTWKVLAQARDLDPKGVRVVVWIDVGTVTSGAPEKTFEFRR